MQITAGGFCCGDWRKDRQAGQCLMGPNRLADLSDTHPLFEEGVKIKTATYQKGTKREVNNNNACSSKKSIAIVLSGNITFWFDVGEELIQFDLDAKRQNYLVWPGDTLYTWESKSKVEIIFIHLL